MKIYITTTGREDDLICDINEGWFDDDLLWKMIREMVEKHNTVRVVFK